MLAARPSTLLRAVFARLQQEGLRVVATSPARATGRMQDNVPRLAVMDLAACATPELVAKAHALSVPIAVLGTTMRSRSSFVARALGARHVMTPTPSVDSVTSAILGCLEAEKQKRSTLDQPIRTTLSELQEAIAQEIRVGLLRLGSVPRQGDAELVIESPQTIATYVRRLRAAVARTTAEARAAPCQLTDQPWLLTPRRAEHVPDRPLAGARLVLVDGNVARADAVTSVLRGAGADVFVCAPEELLGELSRIADLDPSALIVEDLLASMVRRLLDEVGAETRLRWCKLVELPLGELWSASEPSVTVRLEELGPARLLHAIAQAGIAARLSHFESSCLTRVDFASEGLVAGIKVRLPNRQTLEGPLALATFLRRKSGEVRLEQLPDATIVNLLAPVGSCVILASEENPPELEGAGPNLARLTWSTSPGAQVGNITWSNIPALTPEALRQYTITDPSELLDAAEDDDDDEPPTLARPGLISSEPPPGRTEDEEDEPPTLARPDRVSTDPPTRRTGSDAPAAVDAIAPPPRTPVVEAVRRAMAARRDRKKTEGKAKGPPRASRAPNSGGTRKGKQIRVLNVLPEAPFPLGLAIALLAIVVLLALWLF